MQTAPRSWWSSASESSNSARLKWHTDIDAVRYAAFWKTRRRSWRWNICEHIDLQAGSIFFARASCSCLNVYDAFCVSSSRRRDHDGGAYVSIMIRLDWSDVLMPLPLYTLFFFECTQYRSWQWKHVSTLTYRLDRLQFRKQHSRRQFQRLTFQVYIRNDTWYTCGFCFSSCADWYAEQAVCQKTIPMPPWHVNKRWFECAVPQDFSSCCSAQALCLADAVALLFSGRFFSFEWCWFAWCCFLKNLLWQSPRSKHVQRSFICYDLEMSEMMLNEGLKYDEQHVWYSLSGSNHSSKDITPKDMRVSWT